MPFLRALRFGVVIFCIVLASDLTSLDRLLLLLGGTTAMAIGPVCLEHRLAPDKSAPRMTPSASAGA